MSCGFPINVTGSLRPCGKCQGCLRRRRRGWVGRMLAEQAALGDTSFITLTYEDDQLPLRHHRGLDIWIPTLEKSHAKNWIRSVRRKATPRGLPMRFFMAAEYGTKTGRPHYHVILFGIGPTWMKDFEPCWKRGFQSWYPASAASMAYVAKYCLKHGKDPELSLPEHGEWSLENPRVTVPPFRRLSRNPPLGADLATRVIKAVRTPGRITDLLEAEKFIKGNYRTNGDNYPIDRTIKDRIEKQLQEVYGVDELTCSRLLARETYEPTEIEIENARQAHIRGTASRTKL